MCKIIIPIKKIRVLGKINQSALNYKTGLLSIYCKRFQPQAFIYRYTAIFLESSAILDARRTVRLLICLKIFRWRLHPVDGPRIKGLENWNRWQTCQNSETIISSFFFFGEGEGHCKLFLENFVSIGFNDRNYSKIKCVVTKRHCPR